jgi:abequosyltransferase
MLNPKISICIPAYNRPAELAELLESIERQTYKPYEVIICEDKSPERFEIYSVVESFKINSKLFIRYYENDVNLGYDANLRKTISLVVGDYVFLSGNDDLLSNNSLEIVANKISTYSPDIILRSYSSFYKYSANSRTEHRYVNADYLTKFSNEEAAWLFYRSVLVSGLIFKAKSAQELQSNVVDGTLYYQNYLLTKMFRHGTALYVPDILIHNRLVDAGDFGSSEIEAKGDWEPGKRTIKSSIYQMNKFFECAKQAEIECNFKFTNRLKEIASAYSYPLLSYHADKSFFNFINYILALRNIGYQGILFYCYSISLLVLGIRFSNFLLSVARTLFGYTRRIV